MANKVKPARRPELIRGVVARLEAEHDLKLTQQTVRKVYDALMDEIVLHLEAKRDVQLPRMIYFEFKERKAYNGCNPATGEAIRIPAKRVIKMRPMCRLQKLTEIR